LQIFQEFASQPKPTFSRTLLVVDLLQAQPFSDTNLKKETGAIAIFVSVVD